MSQHDAEETAIDDVKFKIYMMEPLRSNRLLIEVTKMIGPSVGPVIDFATQAGSDSKVLDQALSPDFFTKTAETFFKDLDADTVDLVIAAFAEVTEVNGEPLPKQLSRVFQGRLDIMHKWLAWGAQAQWGKSLRGLISAASGRVAALKKA